MKILLINPNRTYYQGSKGARLGLPLGLLYMAAVLEKNNYKPKVFDCLNAAQTKIWSENDKIIHGVSDQYIIEAIKNENPDIVGITSPFTAQIDNAINIANLVKEIDKNITVVVGGPHVSIRGQEFLEGNKNIDIGVKGEGEYVFLEIVKKLENNQEIGDVKSIIYRDHSGKIIENEFGGFIKNLDDLPYPAYHLIDFERYYSFLKQGLKTRPGEFKRSISMITSRGCPFDCVFCSIHLHMGKIFRAHSADYVIKHIKQVVDNFKVDHISLEDDNFTLDLVRAKKILQGIIDLKINLTWDTPNGIRADRFDEELAALMKKSGCSGIIFGIESGSQRVLDEIINKNLKLDEVIKAVALAKKYNLKTNAFFVIGFPGETKKEIEQTKDFILLLKEKYGVESGPLIATPLIGTRLYQICKEKGYLVKEPNSRLLAVATQPQGQGLIKTEDFDPAYLKKIALEISRRKAKIKFKTKLLKPSTYWSSLKFLISHPKKAANYLKEKIF